MTKYKLFIAIGALFFTILACSIQDVFNSKSTLKIINNTRTITVCYLYISPVDNSGWGEDRLKGSQIKPGDSYSIDVDPATYNLKVEDCDHTSAVMREGQDLNSSVEWTLTEASAPSPSTVVNSKSTLKIINNTQAITVCYLYISPMDSSGWGEDQLKGNQIKPGDSYSIDVDPAIYNLKVEDCDHANESTREGQDLNHSIEWTLTGAFVPSPSTVVNSESTLKIINNTQTITVCYLYISPVDSSDWGEDQLKGDQIKPGDSYSIDVGPATYNLKVEDCNHANAATREGQDLNHSIEWTLTETSVPSTVILTVQNDNPNVSICYLYIAPADSSDWGDDMLKGEKILPGGSTNFTLTPGFYNLKAVDCDQSSSATAQKQDITRTTTWTLK